MPDNFGRYADAIQGGNVTVLKSARSVRRWETNSVRLGHTLLQLSSSGGPGLAYGVTHPQYATLIVQLSAQDDGVWLDGVACASIDLAVLPPGCRFSVARTAAVRWWSCGLPSETDIALKIAPPPSRQSLFKTEKRLVRIPKQAALNFRRAIESIVRRPPESRDTTSDDVVLGEVEKLWASRAQVRELPDESMRSAEEAVLRALDYVASKSSEDLQIGDLARAAGVGYRTLLRAFGRYLKISPKRYLKLCRINSVYHAVRSREAVGTLQDILAAHGVNEFGRFAGEYRSIFGELPSATYRRYHGRERNATPTARLSVT